MWMLYGNDEHKAIKIISGILKDIRGNTQCSQWGVSGHPFQDQH